MTSASERTDDDVIVLTEADVVDPPRAGADETSDPAGREFHHDGPQDRVPQDSAPQDSPAQDSAAQDDTPQDSALQDYTLRDSGLDVESPDAEDEDPENEDFGGEDADGLRASAYGTLTSEPDGDVTRDDVTREADPVADFGPGAVATDGGTMSGRDTMTEDSTMNDGTMTEAGLATDDEAVASDAAADDEAVSGDRLTGGRLTDDTFTGDAETDQDASLRGDSSAMRTGSGAFAMPGADPIDTDLADTDLADTDLADTDLASADAAATPVSATPVVESAGASTTTATTSHASESWPEIQAMFVDDPRTAVEHAAEVTGAALSGLVAAAEAKDQSLRGEWQADGTGTEELRTSLQHYRELAHRLTALTEEL